MASDDLDGVKALTFDVFGTVTNWRASVIDEGRARPPQGLRDRPAELCRRVALRRLHRRHAPRA
jgi:hypothetical protein